MCKFISAALRVVLPLRPSPLAITVVLICYLQLRHHDHANTARNMTILFMDICNAQLCLYMLVHRCSA